MKKEEIVIEIYKDWCVLHNTHTYTRALFHQIKKSKKKQKHQFIKSINIYLHVYPKREKDSRLSFISMCFHDFIYLALYVRAHFLLLE